MNEIQHLTQLLHQFIADFQPESALAKLTPLAAANQILLLCYWATSCRRAILVFASL